MIDVFAKYACVRLLKDKKSKTILNGLITIVNEFSSKQNKLWIDQERQFWYSPMQKWFDSNDIFTYSTHNEDQSIFTDRFIRTVTGEL